MTKGLKVSASAAVLCMIIGGGISAARAADVVEPGCTLGGSVLAGFMYDWQKLKPNGNNSEDLDIDWSTPFGEGAGLVTCGGFNIQADVAYYAHSGDISDFSSSDVNIDQTNTHIGGDVFFRDPSSWAAGLQASWISQSIEAKDIDVFRVGLFGEFYLDDVFTLGGSVDYFNTDWPESKNEDGVELAAWGRFYATPDLSLMARGDLLFAKIDNFEFSNSNDANLDGWAITGEGEYLVWDQGLSLLAGARYAQRTLDPDQFSNLDMDDFQVYGGVKFYFGQGGTLVERQRTGTVDNTSLWNEKLPQLPGL